MNEEADLEKPESILINTDYLHLQDLGTTAFTEFDNDGDVVDLYIDNEDLMNYRCGLIHSHHTMAAFFSGTDTEELHEKAENGLYLSLIVNNHMEPVAKICWVGETERTVESYSSWSLGRFIRKPKKHTKKEIMKIYYEIELDIEFDGFIDHIAKRYKELEDADKSFAVAARSAHAGYQTNFADRYPALSNGYESAWDKRKREEKEEEDKKKADKLGSYDFKNQVGQTITLSNGKDGLADLATQLDKFNRLSKAFAVILTQDPKTDLHFTAALAESMNEVKNNVLVLGDENLEIELTEEEMAEESSFMVKYSEEAEEYAHDIILNGDDILAEFIGEFYLEPGEYYPVLQKMYDALSKLDKTILGASLMNEIINLTVFDESSDSNPLPGQQIEVTD